MRHFPIFLDLDGRPVLVVGTASAAASKAEQLARAGALVRRGDGPCEIGDAVLVVCADPDPAVGEAVAAAARARGVPVNIVDRPSLCDFLWPAIVERGPVTIAISTAGTSPVLARRLRLRIELLIPQAFERLAAFAGELRDRVARAIPDASVRRRFWESAFDGRIGELALAGREDEARKALDRALLGAGDNTGHVSLVGAGSGDPELLTLKAVRRIQEADVIVCDHLVDPRIPDLARRDAERILVSQAQEGICALLVRLAREGRRVARIMNGNPFVSGRGDETVEALAAAGIAFDVVPGIQHALRARETVRPLAIRPCSSRDPLHPELVGN